MWVNADAPRDLRRRIHALQMSEPCELFAKLNADATKLAATRPSRPAECKSRGCCVWVRSPFVGHQRRRRPHVSWRNRPRAPAVKTRCVEPRRQIAREIVRRGIANAELRPGLDPDVVLGDPLLAAGLIICHIACPPGLRHQASGRRRSKPSTPTHTYKHLNSLDAAR
jgi:hypothetical protein